MRKVLTVMVFAVLTAAATACGGGPVDPNDTMGPGGMGDDMRVAAIDSS
ncbi:MAG: hypothetical protein HY700_19745 [Gemmatimonadetes bacterium]|nr:hypothetical protein [Gemmatimonadota bacterium]